MNALCGIARSKICGISSSFFEIRPNISKGPFLIRIETNVASTPLLRTRVYGYHFAEGRAVDGLDLAQIPDEGARSLVQLNAYHVAEYYYGLSDREPSREIDNDDIISFADN